MKKTSNPSLFPTKRNNLPRNAFDLSQHHYFTKPSGMLTPILCLDLQPGDYVDLSTRAFTRTQTLNSAAFTRIRECVDYYFISYTVLWRWWKDFISSVNNVDSALNPIGNSSPTQVPWTSGASIALALGSTATDIHGYKIAENFNRLLDMCGYPTLLDAAKTATLYSGQYKSNHFNVFRLYAFARLYRDYYRNSDWESVEPQFFNLDNINGEVVGTSLKAFAEKVCSTMYVNLSKDMVMCAKPSPLYANAPDITFPSLSYISGGASSGSLLIQNSGASALSSDTSTVTAMGIRSMIAQEKLAQLSMLAPKDYRSQIRAHFGVDVDKCSDCASQYIGSYNSQLNIGEVTATASTSGESSSKLGQVAGKGVSSSSSSLKFTSKDFGIIMGIHYFSNESDYSSIGLDQFNSKILRSDYYQPEYDSLGMQPINASVVAGNLGLTAESNVLGYGPRYYEYKSALNRVHGQFREGGTLQYWCTPFRYEGNSYSNLGFCPHLYKVNPSTLSPIFAVSYDGTQPTDQFLCHYAFDITKVSNMSVYGLPNL